MLVDWFTVVAQALNFAILVWLMKRFLYGPIMRAVEARDVRVAADVEGAAKALEDAHREREDFQAKNAAFEGERAAMIQHSVEEAKAEGQRVLTGARESAADAAQKHVKAIEHEEATLRRSVADRTKREVFAVARRALTDLADVSLEERLCDVFVDQLEGLDEASLKGLTDALNGAPGPVRIRSGFDLPDAERSKIQRALEAALSRDVELRFEAAPGIVVGVEVVVDGYKLSWSIDEYLRSMEQDANAMLADEVNSGVHVSSGAAEPGKFHDD